MSTDATLQAAPDHFSKNTLSALPNDPVVLQQMVRELLDSITAKDRQLDKAYHRISLLLQRLYGPRKERINPEQLLLFAEMLAQAKSQEEPVKEEDDEEAAAPATTNRRGHGRQPVPDDLLHVPIVHQLTEAQKLCPDCGQARVQIGEQTSTQLDYHPASVFVIEHIRPTYVCPHCHEQPVTAAKPAQPIDKGLPGPGLLAHVVTSKYADHLPLYRQERILERFGVHLHRSTMCDWMARAATILQPLYDRLAAEVRAARVIHTDDTPVPVQDPKQDKTKTGRLWVYLGDDDHPYTVFDYTPNRRRDGPAEFLRTFRGYLTADAFGGYDGIYLSQPVLEVGCNAHARRKFFEAKETEAAIAHQALAFYRELYEVERQAGENAAREFKRRAATETIGRADLLHAERLRLRQERALPIVTSMAQWLKERQATALPKSPIGQALGYALNHWEALTRYLKHGFLAIDNNVAEREMKKVALGRKNWLFFGSDQGGQTAAVLLSVVSSCQRHGLDPFRYLADVFYRLANAGQSFDELLPDRWQGPELPSAAVAAARSQPGRGPEAGHT